MSNGKINLEKIILDTYGCATKKEFLLTYDISIQMIKDIMKEAINQALELAAENANLKYCESEWDVPEGVVNTGDPEYGYHYIDKQLILTVNNQIE